MTTDIKTLKAVELGDYEQAEYSVIWLHGLGADGNDFVSLVPELRLPEPQKFRFVFPHAPVRAVTMNYGLSMPAWFDIYTLNRSGPIDEAGINKAIAEIHRLIDREIAHGIKAENIFLAGFSQGGYIALLSGLFYPQRLAGLIGLSTFLWQPKDHEQRRSASNQQTPIFIAHGSQDTLVPFKSGENTAETLKAEGYDVSFHSYPMAHSVCLEEINALSQWLQGRIG